MPGHDVFLVMGVCGAEWEVRIKDSFSYSITSSLFSMSETVLHLCQTMDSLLPGMSGGETSDTFASAYSVGMSERDDVLSQ